MLVRNAFDPGHHLSGKAVPILQSPDKTVPQKTEPSKRNSVSKDMVESPSQLGFSAGHVSSDCLQFLACNVHGHFDFLNEHCHSQMNPKKDAFGSLNNKVD